jgi:hypothetical protein
MLASSAATETCNQGLDSPGCEGSSRLKVGVTEIGRPYYPPVVYPIPVSASQAASAEQSIAAARPN